MNNHDYKQSKVHAFDSFCKTVIRNAARDYYRAMRRRMNDETFFSELATHEADILCTYDEYFTDENTFHVANDTVIVRDDDIVDALKKLPADKRDIILLYYFTQMSDSEIAKLLNMVRRTVTEQRNSILSIMRELMQDGNEKE